MSAFDTITQFTKMLENLDRWIEVGIAHAEKKKFDPEIFVQCRLAPDQYAFVRQVQAACDSAKGAAALLAGQTPPSHPDHEKTLAELRARIQTCVTYLKTFKVTDFEGADERRISSGWMQGKWVAGNKYLEEISVPNFYFHATTAYAILRHNGVDLGKSSFMGQLPLNAAPSTVG